MNKISLIIKREYLTRVRKRSFIIMTFLGPLLMAALFIVPVYISQLEGDVKVVGVLDKSGAFESKFTGNDNIHFINLHGPLDSLKQNLLSGDFYALLYIPKSELSLPQNAKLYSTKQPGLQVKEAIKQTMRKEIETLKLEASGIDPEILNSIKSSVNLLTIKLEKGGDEKNSSTELSMAIGFITGLLIYIFIFMYGALVMRGVIEEKTNRIVEVIVSSVKPFQLMMGKIIGVAMVGLTQFVLWIVFTLIIVSTFLSFYSDEKSAYYQSQMNMTEQIASCGISASDRTNNENPAEVSDALATLFDSLDAIQFETIILMFLFYFVGGYLLYASLFAAIGSAVDNETDTQQFMLPLTIPLVLSIVLSQFIINNPDGPAAFWMSIFPLTSPVIMMVRLPFGVPWTDVALSMTLLIAGFIGTTWLAGKIYRTGILMYGKKINYRELWKWIRYK